MEPKSLSKYQLHEELGRGGYGTVYRAYDTVLEVERAVKVLKPELAADKDFIERFKREAKLAAQLDHPRIVPAYDLEEDQGYYFLAMKYMPGKSLKDKLAQKGNLSFDRALEIIQQIAEALDYLHDQNYVHRDAKPGNILFDKDGNAYLSDLGFAKALLGTTGTSQTTTGGMIGTPSYMAPELWREKGVSPATDIYSLGCVFYEMITGKVLFEGETSASIMAKHVIDGPNFISRWPPEVPAGSKRVLRKALTKKPSKRYEKPSKFYQALKALKHKENGRKIPFLVWTIFSLIILVGSIVGLLFLGGLPSLQTLTLAQTTHFQVLPSSSLSLTITPSPVVTNTVPPSTNKTLTPTTIPANTVTSTESKTPTITVPSPSPTTLPTHTPSKTITSSLTPTPSPTQVTYLLTIYNNTTSQQGLQVTVSTLNGNWSITRNLQKLSTSYIGLYPGKYQVQTCWFDYEMYPDFYCVAGTERTFRIIISENITWNVDSNHFFDDH